MPAIELKEENYELLRKYKRKLQSALTSTSLFSDKSVLTIAILAGEKALKDPAYVEGLFSKMLKEVQSFQ
jgi:hypothetical protein